MYFAKSSSHSFPGPYWKKFTSDNRASEIRILGPITEVSGRILAGESLEIIHEMRLVIITAANRHIRPFDRAAGADLGKDFLETADAAEQFWGQPDLAAKLFDEMFMADSQFTGHVPNPLNMRLL